MKLCVCTGRWGGGHLQDLYSRRRHSAAGAWAHKGHSAEAAAGHHQTERSDHSLGENKGYTSHRVSPRRKTTNAHHLIFSLPGNHLLLPAHAHADSSPACALPDSVREQQAVRPRPAVRRSRARPAAARAAEHPVRVWVLLPLQLIIAVRTSSASSISFSMKPVICSSGWGLLQFGGHICLQQRDFSKDLLISGYSFLNVFSL